MSCQVQTFPSSDFEGTWARVGEHYNGGCPDPSTCPSDPYGGFGSLEDHFADITLPRIEPEFSEVTQRVASTPSILFRILPTGAVRHISGDCKAATGFENGELLKPFIHGLHPKDLPTFRKALGALQKSDSELVSYRRLCKGSGSIQVNATLTAVRAGPNGSISEFIILEKCTDVKEKTLTQLSSELSALRSLVQDQGDVIYQFSLQSLFTYVSPSCLQSWGYLPEQLMGHSMWATLSLEDIPHFQAELNQAVASRASSLCLPLRRMCQSGLEVLEEVTILPVYKGDALSHFNAISRPLADPSFSGDEHSSSPSPPSSTASSPSSPLLASSPLSSSAHAPFSSSPQHHSSSTTTSPCKRDLGHPKPALDGALLSGPPAPSAGYYLTEDPTFVLAPLPPHPHRSPLLLSASSCSCCSPSAAPSDFRPHPDACTIHQDHLSSQQHHQQQHHHYPHPHLQLSSSPPPLSPPSAAKLCLPRLEHEKRGGLAGSEPSSKKRKRTYVPGHCSSCGATETPEWRRGPHGPKSLCNACGLKFAKKIKDGEPQGQGVIGCA